MLKKALIIGSGVGGLAAGLRLRALGYQVQILEQNSVIGGKLGLLNSQGYRFDTGPSVFTMPHLVTELFELFGKNPDAYFKYTKLPLSCRYFYPDGTVFNAYTDQDKFVAAAVDKLQADEKTLTTYLTKNKFIYKHSTPIFLEKSLHKLNTYTRLQTLKALLKLPFLGLFKSMNTYNKRLNNAKLTQLFNRYATYNGSNPYKAPGLLNLIAELELNGGVFFPKKGLRSIIDSLYQLAQAEGIEFKTNCAVTEILIDGGKAVGVKTKSEIFKADTVVSNVDVFNVYRKLLPPKYRNQFKNKQERSTSALIFYWGVKASFPNLDLHNIFFSTDYEHEFKCLERAKISQDPTVYVNISSKYKPDDAPPNGENWFVMVNVPPDTGQDWEKIRRETKNNVIAKLNRGLKTNLESLIEFEDYLDPVLIESRTASYRGSLYGTSSNSMFSAFLRHPNFKSKFKGLYFCGGSTHPGGGIPLCLSSAKIVSEIIKHENRT